MQIFYTDRVIDGLASFSREESGHCVRVLRMRRGDPISFTDGKGKLYEGVISDDNPSAMTAEVTSVKKGEKQNYRLHIAISPVKNDDRLEWFIEKAVETGIDEITPLICSRTEKRRIRRDRLEAIILSAMKQSVKTFLPKLNDPVHFGNFTVNEHSGRLLIACCDPEIMREPITSAFVRGDEVTVLIGPEGDFTPAEINQAVSRGYQPVHMGPSRLRTETAGFTSCCSVYLANL